MMGYNTHMKKTIKHTGTQLIDIMYGFFEEAEGHGRPYRKGEQWFDDWCDSIGYDREEVKKLMNEAWTAAQA